MKTEMEMGMSWKAIYETHAPRHPRIMASVRRAGAGVTARLRPQHPRTRSAHAASSTQAPAPTPAPSLSPTFARAPRTDTFAPGVPTIPAIRAARPGQAAIDEADVRAYYDVEVPPFWDARGPRPDLVAVECRHMRDLQTLINCSVSRPDDAVICLAVFHNHGISFDGGPSLPGSTANHHVDAESVFAVQLFDAATGHELGRALTESWP